uniref:Uncharacterized protein n=1 Tax=Oncorhynchus tshawytscha TaxID=74940 RepID=A0AAZ3PZ39_ONCTS
MMVGFVTLVPALCRSFTRSPRVVLGFLLNILVIILTPWGEILVSKPMTPFQTSALPMAVLALAQPIGFWTNQTRPECDPHSVKGRGGTPIQTHCGEETNVR